ncbi:MAG: GatB/YqeY domain-containing protein, partial [Candidatus Cloacimonetes bacterium]|nr:GatB/YqeY domain-containing protein [Candidatus Cloacimonadota bacterium]
MIKQIEKDIISALRKKDKDRLKVLRSLKSAIKYKEIELGKKLSEDVIISVLKGQVKSREQAVELYIRGDRPELAEIETQEIEIIESYLPEPMSELEIEKEVDNTISELEAESMKDMGRVMKVLKEK